MNAVMSVHPRCVESLDHDGTALFIGTAWDGTAWDDNSVTYFFLVGPPCSENLFRIAKTFQPQVCTATSFLISDHLTLRDLNGRSFVSWMKAKTIWVQRSHPRCLDARIKLRSCIHPDFMAKDSLIVPNQSNTVWLLFEKLHGVEGAIN